MGRATLPLGIGTVISFNSQIGSSCVMDFKIVYGNGSVQLYQDGRDVCLLLAVQFKLGESFAEPVSRLGLSSM